MTAVERIQQIHDKARNESQRDILFLHALLESAIGRLLLNQCPGPACTDAREGYAKCYSCWAEALIADALIKRPYDVEVDKPND